MPLLRILALLSLVALPACRGATRPAQQLAFVGSDQQTGVQARLQAVSAVDEMVVWATGVEGSVLRSVDGGETYQRLLVPGASELQFRDVHAVDAQSAFVLSAGEGESSRIYRTRDGGTNWDLQFQNHEATGFLDCFDFWDAERGIAYGDSVNQELYVLRTDNGGQSWLRVARDRLPAAGLGEGGFAASGTCVRVGRAGEVLIGTGAGGNARLLRSTDWGQHFDAVETPMPRAASAGIMSVARAGETLMLFGGDLESAQQPSPAVASSSDGGKSFQLIQAPMLASAIYGAAVHGKTVVVVGPKGAAISYDGAQSWVALDPGEFWSVAFGSAKRFWLVGPTGRVKRFDAKGSDR